MKLNSDIFKKCGEEKANYFLARLPYHLYRDNNIDRLNYLLTEFTFIKQKLEKFEINTLIEDYNFSPTEDLKLINKSLKLSKHALLENTHELPGQLLGRLLELKKTYPLINRLLESIYTDRAWFRPLKCTLTPPNISIINTLFGGSHYITALTISKDRKTLVSASGDRTVKVWDLESSSEIYTIDQYSIGVIEKYMLIPL